MTDAVTGPLWPQEAAFIARAVEGRRAEFTAGRVLARRALAALGGGDCPILAGSRNMPVWPAGYVGSISHTHGHVAAAVGRASDILSIGIDIEHAHRFRPELEPKIASPAEIARNFAGLPPDDRRMALAIMFSAKETFYKCQYPITEHYLGFHDAEVTIDHDRQTFRLTLLTDIPALNGRQVFDGRYTIQDGTIFTAMAMA